jgi:hypothetical protein
MRNENAGIAITAAAVLSALLLVGCAADRAPVTQGAVEVHAYSLSASEVVRVTVTVTAADISPPIVVELTQSGDQWVANLSEIPAGTGRTFTLSAYDDDNVEVYHGVATGVTITAGQTASVAISGQETNPAAPIGNTSPVIDALVAAKLTAAQGESVALSVAAHDGDVGDLVTYLWTATGGAFDTAAQASANWTAPAADGVYRVTVAVADTHGATASMYVDLTVAEGGSSGATISVSLNKWPVVTGVSSTQGRIDVGESTTLDVVATDADNDPLTYAWTADSGCVGAFGDATVKSPTFTLGPTLPTAGNCQFTVTVSDGRGGTNTGSLTVNAAPAPTVTVAPVIISASQSLDRAGAGQTVAMSVNARDDHYVGMTFTWSTSVGTLGTPTTTSNSSEIVWTAPNPFSTAAYVRCTIGNAGGASTTKQFQIFVGSTSTATSTSTSTSTTVDVTPPTVSALLLTPTSVDVSSAAASVEVSFTVADALSGVGTVSFELDSPSGGQNRRCQASAPADAADPLTFASSCTFTFLQSSEPGTWQVKWMKLTDKAGNEASFSAATLASQSLPTTISVQASTADTVAPDVVSLSFSPSAIDTTSSAASVTVTATLSDNLSGFDVAGFIFYSPNGEWTNTCWVRRPAGASQLRIYSSTCKVDFPRYSAAGNWTLGQVYLADQASNRITLTAADLTGKGMAVNLTVTSNSDTANPILTNLDVTPSVNVSASSATVTLTATVTDNLSGVAQLDVIFASPSGNQTQECVFFAADGTTPLSLTDSCSVQIPRYGEAGQWRVDWLYISDLAGNYTVFGAADLVGMGFQPYFTVTAGS